MRDPVQDSGLLACAEGMGVPGRELDEGKEQIVLVCPVTSTELYLGL